MDSHVRERIVGAAVLVALGVWLIPFVLDGPESGPAAASEAAPELALPSPDSAAPTRTETVDLDPRPAAPQRLPGDGARDAVASDEPPPQVRTTPAETAAPAAGPAADGPAAASASTAAAARPAADSAAGGPAGAWSVQVGAFGERANAVQLANRVSAYGYEAKVSEFMSNGEPMHRVRVEGFATRERAEAAGSSLSAHGIPARVVPPD